MSHTPVSKLPVWCRRLAASVCALTLLFAGRPVGFAAAAAKQRFDVAAGAAESALKQFSTQSGRQVIVPTQLVQDVRTQAVKGELTAMAALDLMLASTGLVARLDETTGAFAIVRAVPKPAPVPKAEAARAEKLSRCAPPTPPQIMRTPSARSRPSRCAKIRSLATAPPTP